MAKTFENWKEEFSTYAMAKYLMPLSEFDEDALKVAYDDGETPQEYMDWYADKYDLLNLDEW